LPKAPNWAAGWRKIWAPGEKGAHARLEVFLARGLAGYGALRDRPDLPHTSFGEISPRQILAGARRAAARAPGSLRDIDKLTSELGWREFAHHLLFHFPELPERNWRPSFDSYPWRTATGDLRAWQRGRTGYPFVDAGMRELWQTG
jgi:deoxyribodipyrimidine photo-lyase